MVVEITLMEAFYFRSDGLSLYYPITLFILIKKVSQDVLKYP